MPVGPRLLLSAVVIVSLLPFLGKSIHIDDALFLKSARQIIAHPLDFYGFRVYWGGREIPMADEMRNPPLAAYYLALVGRMFGWRESALHAAFIPIALAAILGTYALARSLTRRPMYAALGTLLTPAFLVSSTTLMSDTMMLAFFIWSIHLWILGRARGRISLVIFAAMIAAAAVLTKYFAIALVPLLLAYTVMRERRVGSWALALGIPVAALAGYELLTWRLYGEGLFVAAAGFAAHAHSAALWSTVVTMAFVGGVLPATLFAIPLIWKARGILAGTLFALVVLTALTWPGSRLLATGLFASPGIVALHMTVFILAGASILVLAAEDVCRHRDAESLLLALWMTGVLFFSAFLNWTVNVRTILPVAPAAAILLARRLEGEGRVRRWSTVILVAQAVLAFAVAAADLRLANSARKATEIIYRNVGVEHPRIWFQGNWGFQEYMERRGARPFDGRKARAGDLLILPGNNTSLHVKPGTLQLVGVLRVGGPRGLTTMSGKDGAGFYSDVFGPLPYAFGRIPEEAYIVTRVLPVSH